MSLSKKDCFIRYYTKERVQELIGLLGRNREMRFAGLSGLWCVALKWNDMKTFRINLKRFGLLHNEFIIYHSLMRLDMPLLSLDFLKRKEEVKKFNENFMNYARSYDLGIDFDAKDYDTDTALNDLRDLCGFFDKNFRGIKYNVKLSGSGFHFEVNNPFRVAGRKDRNVSVERQVAFFEDFVGMLRDMLLLKTVDLRIYDKRRIWKMAFSIDTKSYNVALPLDRNRLDRFDIREYAVGNVVDRIENDRSFFDKGVFRDYVANVNAVHDYDLMDVYEELIGKKWRKAGK